MIVEPAQEPFYGITQRRDRVARYFPILSVGATPSMTLISPAEQDLSDSILSNFAFLNPRKEVCNENNL